MDNSVAGEALPVTCLEEAVMDLMGRLTATELILRVLIATHPEPERLVQRWRVTIPWAADDLIERIQDPHQLAGLRLQMATYSREVDQLVSPHT